ncbi:MAG: cyclic nucleotide-binding domain-containing protein [Candidatus Peregrinibacteria bacterium]|nr:cyclic nucleotide-binding domain-containing protein [Candidatus Peregrinibacteria bacterium]
MENASILPILQKIPLLEGLNEEDHAEIINHITLQFFPAGQLLFSEGEAGDKMYIIKSGKVKIFHPDKIDEPISMLEINDFFGEMALFRDDPRNASAMTQEDSELFLLEKADFYELVLKNPTMANKLSQEFLERVQQNQKDQGV